MATAAERAVIGDEEARMEGKGPGRRAGDAVEAATTRRVDHNRGVGPFNDGVNRDGVLGPDGTRVGDRGLLNHHHHHDNDGFLGHTEEEMARLRHRTTITSEGEAYCPNPNIRDLEMGPKQYFMKGEMFHKGLTFDAKQIQTKIHLQKMQQDLHNRH